MSQGDQTQRRGSEAPSYVRSLVSPCHHICPPSVSPGRVVRVLFALHLPPSHAMRRTIRILPRTPPNEQYKNGDRTQDRRLDNYLRKRYPNSLNDVGRVKVRKCMERLRIEISRLFNPNPRIFTVRGQKHPGRRIITLVTIYGLVQKSLGTVPSRTEGAPD